MSVTDKEEERRKSLLAGVVVAATGRNQPTVCSYVFVWWRRLNAPISNRQKRWDERSVWQPAWQNQSGMIVPLGFYPKSRLVEGNLFRSSVGLDLLFFRWWNLLDIVSTYSRFSFLFLFFRQLKLDQFYMAEWNFSIARHFPPSRLLLTLCSHMLNWS